MPKFHFCVYKLLALSIIAASLSLVSGCGGHGHNHHDKAYGKLKNFPDVTVFRNQIMARFQFHGGFMPPGSQAQRNYIDYLAGQLEETCIQNFKRIPFIVNEWYPGKPSLFVAGKKQKLNFIVLGSIPYSGITDESGLKAPVMQLPKLTAKAPSLALDNTVLLGGKPIDKAISKYNVKNKIVVVKLPNGEIPLGRILKKAYFTNADPGALPDHFTPTYLSGLLIVPKVEAALSAAGAAGLIAILPASVPGKLYAPYPGKVGGLPAVYLDHNAGSRLTQFLSTLSVPPHARLTVNATVNKDVEVDDLAGVVPGASNREIVLASHTDVTNVVEENGPAAILPIVHHYCSLDKSQRPASLRVVLTGAHHAGNRGLTHYIQANKTALKNKVFVALEVEHLGARAVKPTKYDHYETTGKNSPYIVALSSNKPAMINAAKGFSKRIKPSLVGPHQLLGFGAGGLSWATVTNSIQMLSGPKYLLSYGDELNYDIATRYLDYSLLRQQAKEVERMLLELGDNQAEFH